MWRCTTLSNNDVKIIWKYGVPDESDLLFKHTDFFFFKYSYVIDTFSNSKQIIENVSLNQGPD